VLIVASHITFSFVACVPNCNKLPLHFYWKLSNMLFVNRMVVDIALEKIFIDIPKDDKNNDNAASISQKKDYLYFAEEACKSNNVITDPEAAEIVCSKCGVVISDKFVHTCHVSM
jgi:hypothetical protein